MDLKSLLLSVAGVLLLAILLDSSYRYWQQRRLRLKVRLEPVLDSEAVASNSEMVGPTRVLPRDALPLVADPVAPEPLLPEAADVETTAQQDFFAEDVMELPPAQPTQTQEEARYAGTAEAEQVDASASRVQGVDAVIEVDDYIILHVLPESAESFSGEILLRSALAYGLRFGDRSIFHRHEHPSGRGMVLFSMSNAVEPGYFDLASLQETDAYGVTFFLTLPGVQRVQAWELMLDTARRMAHDLGGEVYDQQRMPLSQQLAEHLRRKVQEYERQRLMQQVGMD